MPGLDRTGPRTGGGFGLCQPNIMLPTTYVPSIGRGLALRRGRGRRHRGGR